MKVGYNMKECYLCRVQKEKNEKFILESNTFFCLYDNFPVTKGHCLIVPKKHIESFFDLNDDQLKNFYQIIKQVKEIIQKQFHPDAFNVGINDGKAAGRTINHLHIHLIPRYENDVENPRGGIRNIIPGKGDYTKLKKL